MTGSNSETTAVTSCHDEQQQQHVQSTSTHGISLHFTFTGSEAMKRKRRLPACNVPSLAAALTTVMNSRPLSAAIVPCTKHLLPKEEEKPHDEPSPVDFLRTFLHGPADINKSETTLSHRIFFTKPSEEEMAAYDLEVVSAIRSKDVARLRRLREEGKSFNACNRFGESLLHMACRRGDLGVVTFLVDEVKVRIDVRDDYGRTALHDACWTTTPNREVMDVLMQVFPVATLLAEDVRGHTPFDYARIEHWQEWIEFLKERKDLLLKKSGIKVVG